LKVEVFGQAIVVVFKKDAGRWFQIGFFMCCHSSGNTKGFLEIAPLVWHGSNDIILRGGGSFGTGVGGGTLSIYRLLNGNLYQVLNITDFEYNMTQNTTTRFVFPSTESFDGARVITAYRTTVNRNKAAAIRCVPYRWN
jgi:hypothetical protein